LGLLVAQARASAYAELLRDVPKRRDRHHLREVEADLIR
jgi:hypothetical protein